MQLSKMPNMGLSVLHIHTHTNPNTHTFTRGRFRLGTCQCQFCSAIRRRFQGLLFLLHSSRCRTIRWTVLTVPIPEGCGHLRARLSVTEEGCHGSSNPRTQQSRRRVQARPHAFHTKCYQEKTVFTLKSKPRPSTGAR